MPETTTTPSPLVPPVPNVPSWALAIADAVWAAGCREVVFVPDNPLSHILSVFGAAHREVRVIPATREEEAVGIAAGLYLGGGRPAVLMQSSGLGNALNAICSLLVAYQIPTLLVLSMRGDAGEWNQAQVPFGRAVPRVLDDLGIPFVIADRADTAGEAVRAAAHLAFQTRSPSACLLPHRLTTPLDEGRSS